jgi:hypothetical protein
VVIATPEVDGEPKSVPISGRVRGLIEIGSDDEGGDLHFRVFPRRTGKRESVPLYSEVPGIKLEVDRSRLPAFLNATLVTDKGSGDNRQLWTLRVEVLPNKASGPFPRKDPLYEDSAVYLKASIPGKPPRYLRVAVHGTASEA